PALLLAEADTHLSAEAVAKADTFTRRPDGYRVGEGGQMLTSGASTLLEPALSGLSPSGAASLLTGCRHWQGQALGAFSGSAVFDTCSLGVVVSAGDTAAGYNYQWQFGPSGAVAGAQAAYTFDSAGLYSVILTVSDTCGNSAADTLQVAVEDCAEALSCPCANGINIVADSINGTRLSTLTALGILPPGLLADSCLAVSGLLLVDEDYWIFGGEAYMHPGSEIGVGLGSEQVVFTLSGMGQSPGLHGCGQMWKGIRVGDQARLALKGARIADAQYAVHALNKSKILVGESFFNRNYASLYFDAPGSESFSLEAFLGTEVLGYQPLLPPYAGQSPAPGARPYAGISLRHNTAVEPARIGGLGADTGQQNRFEGLRNGILAENTPLAVHNTSFTDIETAAAEPYPFTGFGIRHTGGAAHPLLQRGRGASRTDGPSFKSCTRAIWVEGTSADIADNYMTDCGYGVQVQLAQNRQVFVNGNLMEVSRTGIDLLSNTPLPILEVAGNDITTTSRGINVEETGIAFTDAAIRSNTVTLAGKGFGLRLRGVNGLEASSNDIYMEQAVQTAAGIRVNGATNCTVRENYVVGPGPDNLFFVGLDVLDGSGSVFDCNTFTELGTGAEFEGSCIGSTVSTNVFEPGTLGLGRGLVYRNSLVIGQQSHEGNLWEVNTGLPNEGYGVAAAVSFESNFFDLGFNSYPVHDDGPPIRPSSFAFPNINGFPLQFLIDTWFPVDEEGEAGICIPGGIVEPGGPKDIHRQAARGELQDSLYGEAMLWAAQLQLYKQLAEAVEWPSDEILDSFYLANTNTAIGQYYLLEKAKEELFHYDSLEGATLNGWETQLQELIGHVLEKDSLIAAGTLGLEASRDSLLDEASALCISLDSLENVLLQSQVALAQQALTDNATLTDTAAYQSKEKTFNAIFLSTLAQSTPAMDSIQEAGLFSIAQQCPLSDGRVVHYARSLYQLINDTDFEDNCEEGQALRGHILPELSAQHELEGSIRIFPNPASSELFLEGYCGRIELANRVGQVVLKHRLSPKESQHTIRLPNLPDGLYFLKVYRSDTLISLHKLVILN
ncbi:MAG: right-handed parallel beta-helix repeat-containing protein, partial [Phaeodactylibacter sp.]|nr:right-handed parallel beta-helix repeat-containing protein [Phaeodactylibacter sp.]